MSKHFFSFLEDTIKNHWDAPAMTDYETDFTMTYGEVAEHIAQLHLLFKEMGLKKGEKVALCGRNTVNWAMSFLAVNTYEAVAVSILPDFHTDSIHALVNHSEASLLFVGPSVWESLEAEKMPELKGIVSLKNFELIQAKSAIVKKAFAVKDQLFSQHFPQGLQMQDIAYPKNNFDDLAVINYTSGTTSAPKGVMLTHRSISSNVEFGQERIPNKVGWNIVSMLPLAHMFGLTFEFLYQLAGGCHVYFLSKTPSPQVLMKAFAETSPYMILTVPLVIEKIFKKTVFPVIQKPVMNVLWNIPGINRVLRNAVKKKLMTAFGGELRYLIVGGAALNYEVENCLKQIRFPYTVGYGMTECGPLLGYEDWKHFVKTSCGKPVHRIELRIDSADPYKEVGEIQVKGDNVMLGYYKNTEATEAIFTQDGWMRTGDLGLIDKERNIYIKGRSKSMILGSSGQNIYPEEIEDKLNNLPLVVESVVVERDEKLVAIVYPDFDAAGGEAKEEAINEVMEQNRLRLNKILPAFARIVKIELVKKEFEKTPKRSIKRFLYK
ncbi:MAG: AMP-binding protein [Bacteroidales bacterium]